MGRVIALPSLQHIYCRLIEWHRMRPAVFVIGRKNPQMAALQADLLPLQAGHVGLPQTRTERVNDFAAPCVINLLCRIVLFQSGSFALAVG